MLGTPGGESQEEGKSLTLGLGFTGTGKSAAAALQATTRGGVGYDWLYEVHSDRAEARQY